MSSNPAVFNSARRPYILKGNPKGGPMESVCFDPEYLRRLIAGEPVTERHFVAYFGELIWIKLRNRIRSPQLIEDVQQETFLRVLKNLRTGGMEHPERLGGYVNSVCNHVMFEAFRKDSRLQHTEDDGSALLDPQPGADERCITRERKEQVAAVLRQLPDKDRELLTAMFLDDVDKDEICRRFDVDRDYLRVLLHRARLRYREAHCKTYGAAR